MTKKYVLTDDKVVVACEDLLEWARRFEADQRAGKHLVAEDVVAGIRISTIFLGLDFSILQDEELVPGVPMPPIVFETVTFGDDMRIERCSTWQQALEQHKQAVARVGTQLH